MCLSIFYRHQQMILHNYCANVHIIQRVTISLPLCHLSSHFKILASLVRSGVLFYFAFSSLLIKLTIYSYTWLFPISSFVNCLWTYTCTFFYWVFGLLFKFCFRKNLYLFLTLLVCFYVITNIFPQLIAYLLIYWFLWYTIFILI